MHHIQNIFAIHIRGKIIYFSRHVQQIQEFIRTLLFQHIVQTSDAVTACGEHNPFIIPGQHILQH